jgi:8-amino-7-oxononanoate synthase
MKEFDRHLERRLEEIRANGLFRRLRSVDSAQGPRIQLDGCPRLNFSSNDYLGLANDPAIKEAAMEAVRRYGAGSGASRLICGTLRPHQDLEEALAAFKGTEAALSFSSGYAAAAGCICALVEKGDIIIIDRLAHACIVDAARLSGATLRVFAHNDPEDLERILRWASVQPGGGGSRPRVLVVTESVFSMDGYQAPLREIAEIKEKHGAWLMVDEAHATGLYGPRGRGLAAQLGVSDRVEVQMGTLGKALGASGGFVCGTRKLADLLLNRARSFVFSTAPVPAAVAAAGAGVRFVQSEAGARRRELVWRRVGQFSGKPGLAVASGQAELSSAIIPIVLGKEARAVEVAEQLSERGFYVPAIRYPTVARGKARLRLTITAAHSAADVRRVRRALDALLGAGSPEGEERRIRA